jgi:hypothetical protein
MAVMRQSYVWIALCALLTLAALLSLPSCGHDQKLVSLAVMPSGGFVFATPAPGATGQFTAIGTYIHPPATKDVTSQATWAVDTNVVSIAGGLATTNGNCGSTNVSATMPEGTGGASNIVIGYSTVTVNNPADPNCPGGGTEGTLSVQISPSNLGTVTSQTYGIDCPTQSCIAVVPAGTSVALTATPVSGHTFLNWTGCLPADSSDCAVTVPTGGVAVVATFQ